MEQNMSLRTQSLAASLPLAERIAAEAGRSDVGLDKRPRLAERAISLFLFACGALSILTTIGFTIVLGSEALRFFATTEWLNANKNTAAAITAADTRITVQSSGRPLAADEIIRFGVEGATENARVVEVLDAQTIIVERGVRGTQALDHAAGTPLFVAADVTLAKFFTDTKWAPQIGRFGVMELVVPTIIITLIAMAVSIPLGLGAAIYIAEYATQRTRGILKPILEILAGVPTVVYGYFALTFMTPLLQMIFGPQVKIYNMASAGIVVGILIIPTISSISEDAISAVPRSLREASYGLGATKLETVFKVLLPAALSGIVAAFILGFSRAVGETMIVLIASGAGPNLTTNPFDSAETMAGHIARISTGDLSFGSIDYNSVFAIGLTLFIMTLLLNFASTLVTRRFREIYQ
jgi:phosphate transport system permease protein